MTYSAIPDNDKDKTGLRNGIPTAKYSINSSPAAGNDKDKELDNEKKVCYTL